MLFMAFVFRPPSVHAPYRKTFIIPLWTCQLGFAFFVCFWNLFMYSISICAGTDSGMNSNTERVAITVGIFAFGSMCIIIAHIVLFSRFRLTARIFVYGNAAIVLLTLISIAIGIAAHLQQYKRGADGAFELIFTSVLCYLSICTLAYAAFVWRWVNSGRAVEMSRPAGKLAGGRCLMLRRMGYPWFKTGDL